MEHNIPDKQIPVQYFLPGRMILLVDHPAGLDRTQLANRIGDSSTIKELGKGQIASPKPEAILTFPLKDDQGLVFSLVPVAVTSASQPELVALLKGIYNQLKDKSVDLAPDVSLRAVSPNWLMSGAIHVPGTGGPGSWPVEAHPPDGESWKFQLQAPQSISPLRFMAGKEADVHVAILDTAPSVHDLVRAYHDQHERPKSERHRLIETLLGPQGQLHVYPATDADLHPLMDYSLIGHRYWMPDHGLFIAGIIHTIAPKATLHLYEVLNPYGIGSIETIAQSLLRILGNKAIKRPLIINCSFMLDIPVEGVLDEDFPVALRDPNILRHMSMSAREIFSRLAKQDKVVVVAAAGNDAKNNTADPKTRPHARFPASFDDVMGVGALPKEFINSTGPYPAATYSNLSDTPPNVGYMTPGGEPGPEKGVLGVYIGEFPIYAEGFLSLLRRIRGWAGPGHLPLKPRTFTPDRVKYKRNTTGWAWWAGTSFATPVVTGILAAGPSGSGLIPFPGSIPPPPYITDQNEQVILVKQG